MKKDEALRLALEALDSVLANHKGAPVLPWIEARDAIKAALEAKDEPVGKLQKPTGERAWFTISELNAWADKKLSENPHWVMPKDEPERDDPPPQRTWVGLTDEERYDLLDQAYNPESYAVLVEAKLKKKNT